MIALTALAAGLAIGWGLARMPVATGPRLLMAALAALAAAGAAQLIAGIAGVGDPWAGLGIGAMAAAALARCWHRHGPPGPTEAALVVLAALAALRLGVACGGGLPLGGDEAQYWDWSRSLDWAYYSKPGGLAWLIAAWRTVAGDGLAALRLLGLLLAGAAIALAWLAARNAGASRSAAWLAAALTALLPLHALTAGLLATDVPLLVAWAGFLAVWLRTPAAGGPARWWHGPALGLCLAAGLTAKYAMLYALGAVALAAATLPQARVWLRTPAPWLALAIGAIGALPTLWWNQAHGWVGLLHVAGQAGTNQEAAIQVRWFAEFTASQIGLGLPAALLLPWALRWAWRVRPDRPGAWLLACSAVVPLGLMLAKSLHAKVQPNWAATAWLGAAVLVMLWLVAAAPRRARVAAIAGAALALLAAVAVAAAPGIRERFPALPPTVPERKLAGLDALAEAVARAVAVRPERTVVLTRAYDLAAGLAWRNRHLPRPICANFGRRMNQYDLWDGLAGDRSGWDAVWADELPAGDLGAGLLDHLPAGLLGDFAGHDQPRLVLWAQGGRTWRRFIVVRLTGFRGRLASALPTSGY